MQVQKKSAGDAEIAPGEYFRRLSIVEESRAERGLPIYGIDADATVFRLQ